MEGYAQVPVSTITEVYKQYNENYEIMNKYVKDVMNSATQSYICRKLGKRTFWHWLYIMPWSLEFTKEQANDHLRQRWEVFTGYLDELEYTPAQVKHFSHIFYARQFLRNECEYDSVIQALVEQCAGKDYILVKMESITAINNFFKRLEYINKKEFPYSL